MESHHPTQHPFSRPHAHINISHAQYPPIPPPPYSSSKSASHTELLHRDDPFLRRRSERDHQQRSWPITDQPRTYMAATASQYPPNAPAGLQPPARDVPSQSSSDGQDISFGTGDVARYQSQLQRGTSDQGAFSSIWYLVVLVSMKSCIHGFALIFHSLAFSRCHCSFPPPCDV